MIKSPAASGQLGKTLLLVLLLVLLNIQRLHGQPTQQVLGTPPRVNPFAFGPDVQENHRLSVLCQVPLGDTPITISWLKDKRPLTSEMQAAMRIQVKPDSSDSQLKFASVKLEHAGNYTCLARNRFGQAAYTSELQVPSEPRWLRAEPTHEPIVATRNQTVVIDCQTTGWPSPRQEWLIKTPKQDVFEPLPAAGRLWLAHNGSLIIPQASKADEANYMCKSTNGVGRGLVWSASLKVNVPAHFASNRPQSNSVRRDQAVQLRCDAFGDEPIAVDWLKDGRRVELLDSNRYSVYTQPIQGGLVSTLVVKKTQRQDNSLFECQARNQAGRDSLPIELQVQEEPDAISDLQCSQRQSRSVALSWQEPYDGRAPITSYIFQYKKLDEEQDQAELLVELQAEQQQLEQQQQQAKLTTNADVWQQAQQLMVAANGLQQLASNQSKLAKLASIQIDKLEPASKYVLRAIAVNAIGQSRFSQPLEFETLEEAPEWGPRNISAQALNSTSIQVSWDEIPRTKRPLHGYYVGYRALASNGNATSDFVFKFTDQLQSGRLHTLLSELKRATNYEISVRAANRQGSGPMVEFVQCKTHEMERPKAVKLSIRREPDDQSIFIEWHRDPSDQNPVDDYTLYQEKNSASQQWLQVRLPGNQSQYKPPGLKCGTRYQFYMVAHNKVGKSPQSEVVAASTSGSLPLAPTKPQLIRMLNSTCLLLNLNAFQEVGCRIKSFETTVRYRVDKRDQAASEPPGVKSGAGVASAAATAAAASAAAAAAANGAGALSAMTDKAAEWVTVRPKGHTHHHLSSGRRPGPDDERLEYLCELDPLGEYNIHVAASTDVGRAEIEYTVLMSSDELRLSWARELYDLLRQLPQVFTYVPSLLVFMLAGLLLTLASMVLYTTAAKYYQKFVIMHNQVRASRRAKRDQRRRRELNGARHNHKLDSWADDYALDDEEEEKIEEENYDGDNDEAQRTLSCHDDDDDDDDDGGMETDIMTDDTSSSSLGGRKYQFVASRQQQRRRQQLQQVAGRNQQRARLTQTSHYLANLNSSSAFDSSSIDSPCNNNKFSNGSTCLSTASTDSIHNRFQCLNSKQYVKMNEYTMLPTISASLAPANDLYGTTTGVAQQQQQQQQNANNSIYYSTLRRTNMQTYLPHRAQQQQQQQQQPKQMALNGSRQSSPGQAQQQSPTRQAQHRIQNQISDIYGYYVSPHQVHQVNQASGAQNYQQVASQQAQREAANSIFVPPQQLIYSAPNMRHQPVFL